MRTGFSLAALGVALSFSSVACGGDDGGPTHFSLKVVTQPAGEAASSSCNEVGSTSGSTSSDNFTVGGRFETQSHNENGSTWYDIRITAMDGVVHAWRFDEAMTRANTTLTDSYVDGTKTVSIRISGSFQPINPCTP